MIRVFTDFQAVDSDESLFILRIGDDLVSQIDKLGIKIGDRVILDSHEDFEVTGSLDFKFVEMLGKDAWVARPDWSTRVDKS